MQKAAGSIPSFLPKDACTIHGAYNYRNTGSDTYPYMLYAFVTEESVIKKYKVAHIPAQTYAVFPSKPFKWEDVTEVISSLQKTFYKNWLPWAEYVKSDAPEFEIYGGTPESGRLEIWFPVIKSN